MLKTVVKKDQAKAVKMVSLLSLAATLRVLADPTRLKILESLLGGLQCNCTIKESLGLPMNLISHHLKLLKEAGLVRAERDPSDARWIYYEIDPQAMAALRDSLFAALDPSRVRPRADHCGPPGCCPPAKPRKGNSMRRTR